MRAMIAMIAMRARISAYSARPWPSSSRLMDEMRALMSCMAWCSPPFPEVSPNVPARGPANLTDGPWSVSSNGSALFRRESQDRRDRSPGGLDVSRELELDRVTDVAEDRRDLAAQEDEGDDRDDRDEGEDQRVLRETLAFLVPTDRGEELLDECHVA